MKKKSLLAICLVTTLVLSLVGACAAPAPPPAPAPAPPPKPVEEWPTRSVELVIPYSAGGGLDLLSRVMVAVAEPYLGKSLVVVLKPGAGATLGVGYAAKQPADGYTWLIGAPTPFYTTLVEPLPYTIDDFTALGLVSNDPMFIFVHADSPYKTLKDLVEDARAKPGKVMAGIVGLYGMQHLPYGFIAEQEKIEWNYIVQPGGGPAMAAVLGKHNETSGGFPGVVGPPVEAGLIRALAVAAEKRLDYDPFKDVPTLKELGYDITMSLWAPVLVRADTPAPIVEKGRIVLKQITEDESFKALMKKMGSVIVYKSGPDTDTFLRADLATVKKIIGILKK